MLTPPPTHPTASTESVAAPVPAPRPGAVVIRELPPEEFHRLDGHPAFGGATLNPYECAVVVAEIDGEIVGTQGIFNLIHLEGMYVDPAYRTRPKIALRILEKVRQILDQLRIPVAFCWTATPEVAAYLTRLGMERLPVETFGFVIDPSTCPQPSLSSSPASAPPAAHTPPTNKPAPSETPSS